MAYYDQRISCMILGAYAVLSALKADDFGVYIRKLADSAENSNPWMSLHRKLPIFNMIELCIWAAVAKGLAHEGYQVFGADQWESKRVL